MSKVHVHQQSQTDATYSWYMVIPISACHQEATQPSCESWQVSFDSWPSMSMVTMEYTAMPTGTRQVGNTGKDIGRWSGSPIFSVRRRFIQSQHHGGKILEHRPWLCCVNVCHIVCIIMLLLRSRRHQEFMDSRFDHSAWEWPVGWHWPSSWSTPFIRS